MHMHFRIGTRPVQLSLSVLTIINIQTALQLNVLLLNNRNMQRGQQIIVLSKPPLNGEI